MKVTYKKIEPVFSTADVLYDVLAGGKKVGALGRQKQDQPSFGYKKGEWGWILLSLSGRGSSVPRSAGLGKSEKEAKQKVENFLNEDTQTNFIKEYVEARGGIELLDIDEKKALTEMSA